MDIMQTVERRDVRLDAVVITEVDGLTHLGWNTAAPSRDSVLPEENIQGINGKRLLGYTSDHH